MPTQPRPGVARGTGVRSASLRALALALLPTAAVAQCGTQWLPDPGPAGTTGFPASTPWDPDGAGPLPLVLVVGGHFQTIGNVAAAHLALYDPVQRTYAPFGPGADGPVTALLVSANGDLVVGGSFGTIGGIPAPGFARYDGSGWTAIGTAPAAPPSVSRLLEMPNGDLVAAGEFTSIAGVPANRIARWNGTAWSSMDVGFSNSVWALAVRPNGELFAAGPLGSSTGNNTMQGVARWTGTGWVTVGGGLPYGSVTSLCVHSSGDLLAGRSAASANQSVARWNGSAWSYVGPTAPGGAVDVRALLEEPNGDVVAIGTHAAGPLLVRRTGSLWNSLAGSGGPVAWTPYSVVRTPAGELLIGVGGWFSAFQTRFANGAWTSDAAGFDYRVGELAIAADGAVIAAGYFTLANGVIAPFVARHDGTAWQSLGGGTDLPVRALDVLPNGDVVVAGEFSRAGTVATAGVARWNGTQWSSLPWLQPIVDAITHAPNGVMYAAHGAPQSGRYTVSRSTGGTWTGIVGHPYCNGPVAAVAVLPNGDVVAGGAFSAVGSTAANAVARWNGTSWSALGSGMNLEVHALRVLANGELLAGGAFTMAGGTPAAYVARWNGTAWSALGAGPGAAVTALAELPDGDLLAGGQFAGGHALMRWDGAAWSPFSAPSPGPVWALTVAPNGRVLTAQAPVVAAPGLGYLRELVPLCPATAQSYGAGCAGSAGVMALSAPALPWLGGTCRTVCTGFAPNGVGMSIFGFGPAAVPLATLLPMAAPGCTVLATADATALLFPTSGRLQWQFAVPGTPALLGVQLRHQVGQVESGAGAQVTRAATSNALTLTIGVL